MNQQDFYNQWRGKFLDFDGVNGAQCVDVIKGYCKEVLGVPPIQGNAIDYFREIPGFKLIKKSLFSYPKVGDIIIFNIGQYGHIGVCVWYRTYDLGVFQQNDPIGTPCGFKDYTYKNVIGWLRPMNTKFTFNLTAINCDPVTLKEAVDKLMGYTPLLTFNARFTQRPPIVPTGQILTQDECLPLLGGIPTPFVFVTYKRKAGAIYADASLIGTHYTIKAMEGISTFNAAYELVHLLQYYTRDTLHVPISVDDIFTPDEAFLKAKLATVLPYLPKLAELQ